MSTRKLAALAALLLGITFYLSGQQAVISTKQEVAVFALGYYGQEIPENVLASVDAEIQRVFIDMGRFIVIGSTERFTSADVQEFIRILQNSKQNNTPLPEEVRFGEVQLTESLMQKLFGAFVVVIPSVVDFYTSMSDGEYTASIKTSVTFLDVAEGTTIGLANIDTSGTSTESKQEAIRNAVNSIPFMLTYEIRKIPAFVLNTQALQVGLTKIEMQFGYDMGIKVGDEFAVIEPYEINGFKGERESGLVMIKNVGPQVSTGTILYSNASLQPGAQLREIPRLGVDLSGYLLYERYFTPVKGWKLDSNKEDKLTEGTLAAGFKVAPSRGFYTVRPVFGGQMNFDTALWMPIIFYGGVEANMYIRRLSISGSVAVAGASNAIFKLIEDVLTEEDDDDWISHYGVRGDIGISVLVSRDMRVFTNVSADYLFGIASGLGGPFQSYGGYGISAGLQFKL